MRAGDASAATPGTPAPTAAELAGDLRVVVNRLAFHLGRSATRHGITPTRLSALVTLRRTGPIRPGDLAAKMGISAASMSRLADILETQGWAIKRPDAEDARAFLLELTERGEETLADLRKDETSLLCSEIAGLSDAQRAALAGALPILTLLADERVALTAAS